MTSRTFAAGTPRGDALPSQGLGQAGQAAIDRVPCCVLGGGRTFVDGPRGRAVDRRRPPGASSSSLAGLLRRGRRRASCEFVPMAQGRRELPGRVLGTAPGKHAATVAAHTRRCTPTDSRSHLRRTAVVALVGRFRPSRVASTVLPQQPFRLLPQSRHRWLVSVPQCRSWRR
jgi:hypothetical protein